MPSNVKKLVEMSGLSPSHISQYFGPWCIQPEPFQSAVSRIQGIDLRQHVIEIGRAHV